MDLYSLRQNKNCFSFLIENLDLLTADDVKDNFLEDYRSSLHDAVVAKDASLIDLGSTDYLSQMNS